MTLATEDEARLDALESRLADLERRMLAIADDLEQIAERLGVSA